MCYSSNVNPFTGGLLQSNAVDPTSTAPLTDELLLGVEHALLPEFVVGLNLTYRKLTNLLDAERLVFDGRRRSRRPTSRPRPAVRPRADYVRAVRRATRPARPAPCRTASTTPLTLRTCATASAAAAAPPATTATGSRSTRALRWSSTSVSPTAGCCAATSPTPTGRGARSRTATSTDPTHLLGGGNRGRRSAVLQGSGTGSGSKGGVYINSKWSYSLNGLYQIAPDHPWGFNVALNLTGRQGYPIPYYVRVGLPAQRATAPRLRPGHRPRRTRFRLDDIHILDARVEKEFTFSDFGLTLGVDCFNVFNEAFVQQRQHRLRLGYVELRHARSPARGSSASAPGSASGKPGRSSARVELRRGATPGGFFCPPFGIHFPRTRFASRGAKPKRRHDHASAQRQTGCLSDGPPGWSPASPSGVSPGPAAAGSRARSRTRAASPSQGATITLRKGDGEVDPKADGPKRSPPTRTASGPILGLAGGAWGILIEKEGFMPSEGQIKVNEFADRPADQHHPEGPPEGSRSSRPRRSRRTARGPGQGGARERQRLLAAGQVRRGPRRLRGGDGQAGGQDPPPRHLPRHRRLLLQGRQDRPGDRHAQEVAGAGARRSRHPAAARQPAGAAEPGGRGEDLHGEAPPGRPRSTPPSASTSASRPSTRGRWTPR